MPQRHASNDPFWGLKISVVLHAISFSVLAVIIKVPHLRAEHSQIVEVATVALRPDTESMPAATAEAIPVAQAAPASPAEPDPMPAPVSVKLEPKKSRKPKQPAKTEATLSHKSEALPFAGDGPVAADAAGGMSAGKGGGMPGNDPGASAEGGSGSSRLVALSRTLPRYPPQAQTLGIEGRVLVSITVSPSGEVSDAKVIDAKPKGMFEEAALDAVRNWKFQPAFKDGRAVEQRAIQEIVFRLRRR